MNRSQVNHRFAAGRELFVIFAQTAIAAKPGKRAFHHPTAGEDVEALLVWVTLDDFQHGLQLLLHSVDELAGIAAIGPEFFQTRLGGRREFGQHELAPSRSWMLAAWTTTSSR
jgi:hypothetical protein